MDDTNWAILVLLCVVNSFFGIAGIFLNSLVILSFWKSSYLRRKVCYFLILVLSCVDLITVAVSNPLIITCSVVRLTGKEARTVRDFEKSCLFLFSILSIYTLLTTNIERYLAIVHPYYYERSVTKRRLMALLSMFWLFVVFQWILRSTISFPLIIPALLNCGMGFLVMTYINSKIFLTVRRIKRHDSSLTRSCNWDVENYNDRKKRAGDLKKVSTCLLLICCFFVCYAPIVVHRSLSFFYEESLGRVFMHHFELCAETLVTLNSVLNCLIFFWKNKTLRQEGKRLLKCRKDPDDLFTDKLQALAVDVQRCEECEQ